MIDSSLWAYGVGRAFGFTSHLHLHPFARFEFTQADMVRFSFLSRESILIYLTYARRPYTFVLSATTFSTQKPILNAAQWFTHVGYATSAT